MSLARITRRFLVVSALALALLFPSRSADAQEALIVGVRADARCGGENAAAELARAIQERMPEGIVVTGPPASTELNVDVEWAHREGTCRAELRSGSNQASLDLPRGANDEELAGVASRVVWFADAFEPTPEPEPIIAEALPAEEGPIVPFGFSVIDGVYAPAHADENAVRRFSLTLFGSRTRGLHGVEFGMLYNQETEYMRGAQMAPVNLVRGDVRGLQYGGVNISLGETRGVQAGGIVNVAREDLVGAQFGFVNMAGDVRGAQLGTFNRAKAVRGLQFGLINVADTSTASIGLINIMREEPVYGLAWGDSDGTIRIGIQHGSRYFRHVLAAGVSPFGDTNRWAVGGGFVGHIPARRFYIELDVLAFAQGTIGEPPTVSVTNANDELTEVDVSGLEFLGQARASLGYGFGRFGVYAGVAQNMLVTRNPDHEQPWSSATPIDLGGDTGLNQLYLWPSFFAGIRF